MIVKTCTQCRETQKEALFWTVGAWQRADGVRVSYKHKLCLTCVTARIAPLQVHSDESVMTCPNCGMDTSADYDAVYISWIPKGVGMLQAEAPFCNACAARWRVWFMEGADELEDRNRTIEGRPDAPRFSAAQTLASLGITLRD